MIYFGEMFSISARNLTFANIRNFKIQVTALNLDHGDLESQLIDTT